MHNLKVLFISIKFVDSTYMIKILPIKIFIFYNNIFVKFKSNNYFKNKF